MVSINSRKKRPGKKRRSKLAKYRIATNQVWTVANVSQHNIPIPFGGVNPFRNIKHGEGKKLCYYSGQCKLKCSAWACTATSPRGVIVIVNCLVVIKPVKNLPQLVTNSETISPAGRSGTCCGKKRARHNTLWVDVTRACRLLRYGNQDISSA